MESSPEASNAVPEATLDLDNSQRLQQEEILYTEIEVTTETEVEIEIKVQTLQRSILHEGMGNCQQSALPVTYSSDMPSLMSMIHAEFPRAGTVFFNVYDLGERCDGCWHRTPGTHAGHRHEACVRKSQHGGCEAAAAGVTGTIVGVQRLYEFQVTHIQINFEEFRLLRK